MIRLLGQDRAPAAFTSAGFLLAIPVFFDTVFYLMIPLAKAMRWRTGRSYIFYILAVVAGGTMAHSLVPPTPGPLFVAGEFKVDLGLMIILGFLVGSVSCFAGYLFARRMDRRMELPLRESEESLQQLARIAREEDHLLPPTWLSILPILLPVILIAGRTVTATYQNDDLGIVKLASALGEKNLALMLAAAVALMTLRWKASAPEILTAARKALTTAGVIILIIGAGGAFGLALQQTGIGEVVQDLTTRQQLGVLPLAFLLTTLIRTAQGSATVAMITAAGTLIGIADPAQLGFNPVYLALAIGCGSKPIWWMNDSGFWVVVQMSGMNEREGLKTLTPMTAIMGTVGLLVTMAAAYVFPLV
jgi:GntP family gluconate:H+ symporter